MGRSTTVSHGSGSASLPEDLAAWTPAAVVFDCDGLLVDTEPCWTVAETELFARRGLPFGEAEKAMLIGKSVQSACAGLEHVFSEPGAAGLIAEELMLLVERALCRSAKAMAGAVELVQKVAERVPVAVASNSPRYYLDASLSSTGLLELVPVTLAADEVAAPKPDPELYEATCRMLGVEPSDCLAFEDSSTGVRSAKAAGLRVVGVPTLPSVKLDADVVLPRLGHPALVRWVETW